MMSPARTDCPSATGTSDCRLLYWGFRGRQALAEAGAAVIVDTAVELLEVLR